MYTVIGLKHVVSKKDGVNYFELHLTSEDRFVEGLRCDVVFLRRDMIKNVDSLVLGSLCNVAYNRFGRVDFIEVLI